MREIKFRAWDTQEKLFIDPEHVVIFGNGTVSVHDYNGGTDWHDNGPIEISLFTGLLDKNGKEIYEGDVVERINHRKGLELGSVRYDGCSFGVDRMGRPDSWAYLEYPTEFFEVCEIIGNIYQDSHLIENPEKVAP